jgi:hypothetical protein
MDWDHADNADRVHYVLGFNNAADSTAVANGADFELFGDFTVDLTGGIRSINVHSDLVPSNHVWGSIHQAMDGIIESVPLSHEAAAGDVLVYTPANQSYFVIDNFSSLSSVSFYLKDNLDNEVDLGNKSWLIELSVDAIDL